MHQFCAIWGIDATLVDKKLQHQLKTDGASQETHLVVAVENNDLCKRTVRYITALVRRCPIVTIDCTLFLLSINLTVYLIHFDRGDSKY